VIALDDEHLDARLSQSDDLLPKEQGSAKVPQVSIKDVSSQDYQVDVLIQSQINQCNEGSPACTTQLIDRRSLITVQTTQGTIDMQVCSVDELQSFYPPTVAVSGQLNSRFLISSFTLMRRFGKDSSSAACSDWHRTPADSMMARATIEPITIASALT
jgi:hypothetical protein